MSNTQNIYPASRSANLDLSDDNQDDERGTGRWWAIADKEQSARSLVATVDALRSNYASQIQLDTQNWRLYGGSSYYSSVARPSRDAIVSANDDKLRLNVCRSCVDTATAKVAKSRPKPMFLTDGGTWSERQKTKKLDRFVDGLFHELRIYEKSPMIFRDGGIFGTGALKVYSKDGRPAVQRTFPSELLVDPWDAQRGDPRTLYQVWWVDQEAFIAWCETMDGMTKKRLDAIAHAVRSSTDTSEDTGWGRDPSGKQVRVIEAWHLPSTKDGDDGRHAIAVRGGYVFSKQWTRQRFPFAFFRWSEPVMGFWGTGIISEITPIQKEINYCLQKLQRILTLHAQPMTLVRRGAKLQLAKLATNALGSVHEVDSIEDVKTVAPPPLAVELVTHINNLVNRAYENTGVSQLSSQSLKPAGLDSGVALRTYEDIETGRFAIPARSFEQFHLDVAELLLDEVRELDANDDFKVMAPEKTALKAIRWGEVAVEQGDYLLKCWPVNMLPQSPAGRIAFVQELMNAGLFKDPREGLKLLDFPDLEAFRSRQTAMQDVVDQQIGRIIEEGEVEAPEPTFDIDYAFQRSLEELALGQMQGMPEDRMEMLRLYNTTAQAFIQARMQPPAAAATPAEPAVAHGPMGGAVMH